MRVGELWTFFLSRKWMAVVIVASVAKLGLIFLTPPRAVWGDFFNWITDAQYIALNLSTGHFSSILSAGAYLGLGSLIAPLFVLWRILPVPHPPITEITANPSTSYSLLLIMKLPIFLFDLATGVLLVKLVHNNGSELGQRAFLSWYLNPYNWIWLYLYSTFDVIPTAIVILAVLLGMRGRWLRSGLCLSFAAVLRLYPILLFPFFFIFANRVSWRSVFRIAGGFALPLCAAFLGISFGVGSSSATALAIVNTPLRQGWLLLFYGVPITSSSIVLTPFLLLVQIYVTLHWTNKNFSLIQATLVSLLLVFVGSYHHGYHFLWVSPFLSAHYDLDRRTFPLYILIFVTALLSPITYEGGVLPVLDPYYFPLLLVLEALAAGAAIACKLFYVLRLNLNAINTGRLVRFEKSPELTVRGNKDFQQCNP